MPPKRRLIASSSESGSESSSEDVDVIQSPSAPQTLNWLPLEQVARINRMNADPLYLIDISVAATTTGVSPTDGDKCEFKVSGSTANLYSVTLATTNVTRSKELATCTCPDAALGAKFRKCHCKHVCFVLLRVLKCSPLILKPGTLQLKDLVELRRRLKTVETNRNKWGTPSQLLQRYDALTNRSFDAPADCEEMQDECAICFSPQSDTKSLRCPQCHNCFHADCITLWLRTTIHKKCPLCRDGAWSQWSAGCSEQFINLGV